MSDRRKVCWNADKTGPHSATPSLRSSLETLVAVLDLDAASNRWHLMIALSPLLAGVWLAWVQLRTLRRCEEYLGALAVRMGR